MTDLEMTKLCAEAMGLDWEAEQKRMADRDGKWLNGYETPRYDPLTNDAQAMALAKRFMMEVDFFAGAASIKKPGASGWGYIAFSDDSINRAIVECVSKMQAEKQPPYVGERNDG